MHHDLESICLPDNMCLGIHNLDDLISFTFPNIIENYKDVDFWKNRAILTALNDDVDLVNNRVLELFPGDVHTYYSADSVVDTQNANIYPVEFLNTLQPSGCPPHVLILKVGMIVMLLRSLAYQQGLCNGTRLIVCRLGQQIIEAEIVSGKNVGERVLIPRIPLVPTSSDMPFDFERLQFPIRAAFAMTINKAQGQTMEVIGLFLPRPVFSHGQLYVALSRVRKASCIRALVKDVGELATNCQISRYTPNIVYSEVL